MEELQGEESKSVDAFLDSNLESVDNAEELVLNVAEQVGFEQEDLHKIGMAVRETVVNAVVHGNRYNSNKKVHLTVAAGKRHIAVTVGDEGNGFDLGALPDPLAEENLLQQSGRGILLIRAFVDEFQMRRVSPAGTEVRLVKYLPQSRQ